MQALLAHPGTQYSGQLARQLQQRKRLFRFWTGFALPENSFLASALGEIPPKPPSWLGNRIVPDVPATKIRTRPILDILALLRLRFGTDPQIVFHHRNDQFQKRIPTSEIIASDVVIGFDTSSSILVKRAAAAKKPFILDQTIAHPRSKEKVYRAIQHQFPDWADDLDARVANITAAETSEHDNADRIVAASSFTRRTLIEHGINSEKVLLNPYGVDLKRFAVRQRASTARPFRFVFAGLVCARKGIPLLLQAWAEVMPKNAELWIAGTLTPTALARLRTDSQIKILGKVSNVELAKIMSESDVFVFPSYFEGFGLVILEAMACGLPVITTTATAGPDIVTEGEDGWIIEAGDLDALINIMRSCLRDRDRIRIMGDNARMTAERFSWDAYGDRWVRILQDVCG